MGNLFITDTLTTTAEGRGRILKETLQPDHSYVESLKWTSDLNAPFSVAVDRNGNVYVADTVNNRVLELDFADPPGPFSFATTHLDSTSTDSPKTVPIENIGNATLTFPAPETGSNPVISPASFTLSSSGSTVCPLTESGSSTPESLVANATCDLTISFTPAELGTIAGALTLTNDSLNAPAPVYATQTISLNGIGWDITLSPATLPDGFYGTAYSETETASGGVTPPYAFALTTGSLPPGLALNTTGVISGTPTVPGSYTFTVTATDSTLPTGLTGTRSYTLVIEAAMGGTGASTTLVVSPAMVVYGDTSVLTATVAPAGATGTVTFTATQTSPMSGGSAITLRTSTVDGSGQAVWPESTLSVGTYDIVATYNGDPDIMANSSAAQTLTVTLRTGPNGKPALTVVVNDATRTTTETNPPFSYNVLGTLYNGNTTLAAVTGTPSYSTTASATTGQFAISVTGLTSQNYTLAFVDGTLTVVATANTTTLAISPATSEYGNPVTLTATVNATAATGTVSFYDDNGATYLGNGTLDTGVATLTTSSLTAGSYTIMDTYLGDGNYAASTSAPAMVTVDKRHGPAGLDDPALTVTTGDATRQYGQGNPAFSYAVSGALVNGDTYATTITGVPVFTTPAEVTSPVGQYPVSVNNLNSASYVLGFVSGTLTVTKGTPSPTLSISPNPPLPDQPSTITATLPAGTGGSVTFTDNGTPIQNCMDVPVVNSEANCTATLPVGIDFLTGTYNGDANNNAAPLPTLTVTVTNPADYAISATPQSQIVPPGALTSYKVNISSVTSSFNNLVTLTATGLPPGATVSFTPASVIPEDGGATSTMSITVPKQSAMNPLEIRPRNTQHTVPNSDSKVSLAFALLLLQFVAFRRGKKQIRLLIFLLAGLSGFSMLTACGSGGYFSQPQQTYTITITGTSGSLSHSASVFLTVE
ncbi:MAG: Ig-like domain repeat protein [Acidobacteriaceae bacterium]|nr:Ig-like domain repeat protein [Acidobacteriaceae bacterium]